MKNFIALIIILLFISCAKYFNKDSDNRDKGECSIFLDNTKKMKFHIGNIPNIDIYNTVFDFNKLAINEDLIIDSLSFIEIYQIDSLIKKYNSSIDYGYLVGKYCSKEFVALIIERFYGAYIKSLELLTYNDKGSLIGFMFLAASGGEDFYEAKGYFGNDSIYFLTTVSKDYDHSDINLLGKEPYIIKCDSSIRYFVIRNDGKIIEK